MKKMFLTALLAVMGIMLHAQKLEKAKDLLGKKKLNEARTEIDNVLNQMTEIAEPACAS